MPTVVVLDMEAAFKEMAPGKLDIGVVEVIVRINHQSTRYFKEDMKAIGRALKATGNKAMVESTQISTVLPASPERLYKAWLSSREHSAFTGDKASIKPVVGSKYTAGGTYIWGTIVTLVLSDERTRLLPQSWLKVGYSYRNFCK